VLRVQQFLDGQAAKIEIGNRSESTNYALDVVARPSGASDVGGSK
jgi:hypothetical protein